MSKGRSVKKDSKKPAVLTPKEKRAAKKQKKLNDSGTESRIPPP